MVFIIKMGKKDVLTIKEVFDACKNGNFKQCLYMLHDVEHIDDAWSMRFIFTCYNCIVNVPCQEKFTENDLFKLLNHLVSCISQVEVDKLRRYFQCLFYILKFFIEKKCYHVIVKMESILVPPFLPSPLPEEQISIYESSANILYNFVITSSDNGKRDFLLEICDIICKMFTKLLNISSMLSLMFGCTKHLFSLQCHITKLEAIYFRVLDSAKVNGMKKLNTESDFKTFLSYFLLIYQEVLKRFHFDRAEEIYEKSFESVRELFTSDICTDIFILLKFPLSFSPLYSEEKLLKELSRCKRSLCSLDVTDRKKLAGKQFHKLIHHVARYYKVENRSQWCDLSAVCQLQILEFIREIGKIELIVKYTCPCKCLMEKNVCEVYYYYSIIKELFKISAHEKCTTQDLDKGGVNLFAEFCKDILLLKQYNCEKWKIFWTDLGTNLHHLGSILYINSDEGYSYFLYSFIKYYTKFELQSQTNIPSPIIESTLNLVCYKSTNNCKKCMALVALGIKLCDNLENRMELFVYWIKSKASQRNMSVGKEIQKITLVSAFTLLSKEMEYFTDGADLLTPKDKVDLLVFELFQYKSKWRSKISMMSALKGLCDVADVSTIAKVIVDIFGDCDIMLHEDVPNIFQNILRQYEKLINGQKSSLSASKVYLAVLYQIYYKYCVKDVINKNSEDMERFTSFVPKSEGPPDSIPIDPNEECDIVSSYDSLTLNKFFAVMKYLHKALDLFTSIIKDDFDGNGIKGISTSTVYNWIINIAMEYRLHCYKIKHLQALELALKIAETQNNAANIVWAISFIIELSDMNKSRIQNLTSTADELLKSIDGTNIANLKVILTYYICKAKSLLYVDYKESFRIFQMANELYDKQELKSSLKLIKAQLEVIHFRFVLMPCSFDIVDHQKSTLLTIHQANALTYKEYNESDMDGAYEMSILLDTNEELVKLNYLLHCPREVRAYCRETIILSQRLVLPIRCAYYLVYLAHADLRSLRYNDAKVKIQGLTDILCLSRYNTQVEQGSKSEWSVEIDKNIAGITKDMREMVLDVPVPDHYKKQFSPSSPTLVIQPFRLPSFLNHEDSCDCYYCISLEYQDLVLQTFLLESMLNVKEKNDAIAFDFFRGSLKFYELALRKYKICFGIVSKMISHDLVPEFEDELIESYGFSLLYYSYHIMRSKDKSEALRINSQLVQMVTRKKVEHIYLYHEALFQRLNYIVELPPTTSKKEPEMETLCPEPNFMSTTPESKQSKVTFSVTGSTPNLCLPQRRVKKCIPFNLSPNQDSFHDNEAQLDKQPKTPARKVKISKDGTAQKSKSSKTVHIFNDEDKRRKKKELVNEDSPPCTSSSTIEKTPGVTLPPNTDIVLKSRTRLLTERLRQSSKKPEVSVESDSEESVGHSKVSNGKKKLSSRKNLFDHEKVEKESTVPHGGAIKKVARTRRKL